MEEIILFLLSFVFVLLIYQLFLIRPLKKKKSNKELMEIKYLAGMYKIDLDKINYNQLLQICAITSSLDISIGVNIIFLFDNFIMELVFGFISICVLIFISYHFVYLFYKKKGMIKNGKHK